MATTKDGYSHNADGTYSYKGQVIPGVTSLGQARAHTANPNATGGNVGGPGGSGPKLPKTTGAAFTDPSASYQADFNNNPASISQGNLAQNANMEGPFGSQNFTVNPKSGQLTNTQSLSAGNQAAVNGLQGNAGTSAVNVGHLLDQGAFNGWSGAQTPGQAAQTDPYTEAVFGQLTNHLTQNYTQQKQDKAQELQNRGIPQGSDEWTREMKTQVEQPYNDAIQQAQNQAVTSGATMQNQAVQTQQGINQAGYIQPGFSQSNAVNYSNMYTNPTQVGQVFGTLANQNLAAQAAMQAAKAAGLNANVNAGFLGIAAANAGGQQPGATSGAGTGAPRG